MPYSPFFPIPTLISLILKKMSTFQLAFEAWQSGAGLRRRRARYKRYTYGRQWDDPVRDRDGNPATEASAARLNGERPMTNNLIRQLIKSVIGNFRTMIASAPTGESSDPEPDEATARRNSLTEMDCRLLEEFLISGCAIQRVVAEKRIAGAGVWVDNVSPDDFFVNRFTDPRGLDIELIGMLHSMSLREVIMRYGRTPSAAEAITRDYSSGAMPAPTLSLGTPGSASRFFSASGGRCRVIEVWTLESRSMLRCHDPATAEYYLADASGAARISEVNGRRRAEGREPVRTVPSATLRWHCRIYSPSGLLLDEYDSPYRHGSHPFVLKFYPLIDGEVHSLVEDIIDQQRCINSLITLIDQILSVAAKGVLLFPEDQLIDGMDWDRVGSLWAQPGSVVPYNPNGSTHEPHQIVSSCEQSGAYRLLETQLDMFQRISGVNDVVLRGQSASSRPSAALLDSQLRSSAIAMLDMLDSFNAFRAARNQLIAGTERY